MHYGWIIVRDSKCRNSRHLKIVLVSCLKIKTSLLITSYGKLNTKSNLNANKINKKNLTRLNAFPKNWHIIVPVCASLFMTESQCMGAFVDYDILFDAPDTQADYLYQKKSRIYIRSHILTTSWCAMSVWGNNYLKPSLFPNLWVTRGRIGISFYESKVSSWSWVLRANE